MLREENIAIEIKSQGYECKTYTANVEGTEAVLLFESRQRTADMRCPVCGSTVHIYDSGSMNLRDMPIWVGCKQELAGFHHGLKTEVVKSGINTRVKQALDENGIEIPYNYVNVVVNERKESTRQLNVKEIIFATAVAGYYHCIMLP